MNVNDVFSSADILNVGYPATLSSRAARFNAARLRVVG